MAEWWGGCVCSVLRAGSLGTCEGFEGGAAVAIEQDEGVGGLVPRPDSDDSIRSGAV